MIFYPIVTVFFWFLVWLFGTVIFVFLVLTPIRYLFSMFFGFIGSMLKFGRL